MFIKGLFFCYRKRNYMLIKETSNTDANNKQILIISELLEKFISLIS